MKKINLATLSLTETIEVADKSPLMTSSGMKNTAGNIIIKKINCPANTEIDTGVSVGQLVKIWDEADMHIGLCLMGWHTSVGAIAGTTLSNHFGVSSSGTQSNLLYRKINGGNFFIKRNKATSSGYTLMFFK